MYFYIVKDDRYIRRMWPNPFILVLHAQLYVILYNNVCIYTVDKNIIGAHKKLK